MLNVIGRKDYVLLFDLKVLFYRMHDPDVVILLFASGKLMCTGAVNEKMVYDAVDKLMAELIQKGC
ncbi:MAG: hypothetical protein QXN53_04070 [Thermoproteota archaeon]